MNYNIGYRDILEARARKRRSNVLFALALIAFFVILLGLGGRSDVLSTSTNCVASPTIQCGGVR